MKNIYLLLLTLTLVLFLPTLVSAQNNSTSKQVYLELGGPGMISFNFDGRFSGKSQLGLGYRIGVGAINAGDYDDGYGYDFGYKRNITTIITFPLGLNYIFGKLDSNHAFEVGAGCTLFSKKIYISSFDSDKPSSVFGYLSFMYRRVPVDGGFTWRIGITPFIDRDAKITPSLAVGLGYAF